MAQIVVRIEYAASHRDALETPSAIEIKEALDSFYYSEGDIQYTNFTVTEVKPCEWTATENGYDAGCGNFFEDSNEAEREVSKCPFCCFCGGELRIKEGK